MSEDAELDEARGLVESTVENLDEVPLPVQVDELRRVSRLYRLSANIIDVMVENKRQELSVRKLH